ncbi:MAG: type II toxin-antitoxin system HipA family toxin [Akkermansiaceae bacterium]
MTSAFVRIFGTVIGNVSWNPDNGLVRFCYADGFDQSGIELSPLMLPLQGGEYSAKKLPGLLLDSLPEGFAQLLMPENLNPVEQLLEIGNRGMGALEFHPSSAVEPDHPLQLTRLAEQASALLTDPASLPAKTYSILRQSSLPAGGDRPKALVTWNPGSNEIFSSQQELAKGFEHWLVKLDGIYAGEDASLTNPQGNCRIEYAYSLMARDAGIEMSECRIHEEAGRAHFMTRRFDRTSDGKKIHVQTLAALAHLDSGDNERNSYETIFQVSRRLGLPYPQLEQLYRRAVFNLFARIQDDAPRNVSFLMNRRGKWSLAPAYDLTFSYQPTGAGSGLQIMSLNRKRDNFTVKDLMAAAHAATVKPRKARAIIEEVRSVLDGWSKYAFRAKVPQGFSLGIAGQFRDIR